MKVIIGDHIIFEEDDEGSPYATIYGDYKMVDMKDSEFNAYIDETSDDWISSNYEGVIYQCKKIQPFA
jgi:hypothetical protein